MGRGSGQAGQQHKAHKGGKKRQNKEVGGKSAGSRKRAGLKQQHQRYGGGTAGKKAARVHAMQQNRQNNRSKVLEEKRLSSRGPPKIVALIPLCSEADAHEAWRLLTVAAEKGTSIGHGDDGKTDILIDAPSPTKRTFAVPGVKLRLTVLPPFASKQGAPLSAVTLLEYVKGADIVIFLTSSSAKGPGMDCIDNQGQKYCEVLRAFGLPSVYAGMQGIAGLSLSEKSAVKKRVAAAFKDQVRDSVPLFPLDTPADCLHMFRTIKEQKHSSPTWRQHRPYLVVDKCECHENGVVSNAASSGDSCTFSILGYLRGQNLSVHQVMSLPGVGEFSIERVERARDPLDTMLAKPSGDGKSMETDDDTAVLAIANHNKWEPIVRENVPDPLAGEQTWPTEQEMMEAEAAANRTVHKKVPKGYSEYQSAWIVSDEEDSGDEDEGSVEGDQKDGEDMEDGEEEDFDVMSEDSLDLNQDDDEDENDMTPERYAMEYERQRNARRDAETEDLEFPDEVEVPVDAEARKRFGKYRGLKSFRTSPWDPRESLPREYSKIFAFENPIKAQKTAKNKLVARPGEDNGLVSKGQYVRVYLAKVQRDQANAAQSRVQESNALGSQVQVPYIIFGLLQHETKMSVVNFSVTKASSYSDPVRNKDEMLFYTGVRMFKARPIISDAAPNADKHKNQRFLRAGERSMMSVYAPILHPPLSVLCFKDGEAHAMAPEESQHSLVAGGLLSSVDPDRIVLKRIILSGYPYKVHKKKAYVRWMFHNPPDIKWFSPLELWTKYGRRGKIREPVGTHGTMKCMFDGVIQQRDTICMSLYKRVYPKWNQDEAFLG